MRGTLVILVAACGYEHGAIHDAATSPGTEASIDGAIDAPIDAPRPPFQCTTDALVCAGQKLIVSCNNDCWIKCTHPGTTPVASPLAAKNACLQWGGELAAIRNATDQACLEFTIFPSQAHWIGFEQASSATMVKEAWSWGGDGQAPAYDGWGIGQPDDAGGGEGGQEQCAFMNTLGDWHDAPCTDNGLYRFSCRHD